jgi:hypothetical protein
MAFCRQFPDNQRKDKHVESIFATRMDEGSTPSSSTGNTRESRKTTEFQGNRWFSFMRK